MHCKFAIFTEDAAPFFHIYSTTLIAEAVSEFGVLDEN